MNKSSILYITCTHLLYSVCLMKRTVTQNRIFNLLFILCSSFLRDTGMNAYADPATL